MNREMVYPVGSPVLQSHSLSLEGKCSTVYYQKHSHRYLGSNHTMISKQRPDMALSMLTVANWCQEQNFDPQLIWSLFPRHSMLYPYLEARCMSIFGKSTSLVDMALFTGQRTSSSRRSFYVVGLGFIYEGHQHVSSL